MDPMRRWELLRPIREYTPKELRFLDMIQSCSLSRRSFRMFDVNRKKMNRDAVVAMSIVRLHEFNNEQENLCQPFKGTLTMRDLDCVERPFLRDALIPLQDNLMVFAIAEMAELQHYSLAPQTLVIDLIQKNAPRFDDVQKILTDLRNNHEMPNPFDKDLLIFPSFRVKNSFVTVVKNPRKALDRVVNGDADDEAFEEAEDEESDPSIWHFATGDIKGYTDIPSRNSSVNVIEGFLDTACQQYCPEFVYNNDKTLTVKFEFRGVENGDRAFVILSIIHELLRAEYEFPNIEAIGDRLMAKSDWEMKRHANEFRRKIAQMVNNTIEPTRTVEQMLNFRQEIIQHNNKEQDNTISSSTN